MCAADEKALSSSGTRRFAPTLQVGRRSCEFHKIRPGALRRLSGWHENGPPILGETRGMETACHLETFAPVEGARSIGRGDLIINMPFASSTANAFGEGSNSVCRHDGKSPAHPRIRRPGSNTAHLVVTHGCSFDFGARHAMRDGSAGPGRCRNGDRGNQWLSLCSNDRRRTRSRQQISTQRCKPLQSDSRMATSSRLASQASPQRNSISEISLIPRVFPFAETWPSPAISCENPGIGSVVAMSTGVWPCSKSQPAILASKVISRIGSTQR